MSLCCHHAVQAREKKLAKELVDMTKSFKAAHRTMLISLPSVSFEHHTFMFLF